MPRDYRQIQMSLENGWNKHGHSDGSSIKITRGTNVRGATDVIALTDLAASIVGTNTNSNLFILNGTGIIFQHRMTTTPFNHSFKTCLISSAGTSLSALLHGTGVDLSMTGYYTA